MIFAWLLVIPCIFWTSVVQALPLCPARQALATSLISDTYVSPSSGEMVWFYPNNVSPGIETGDYVNIAWTGNMDQVYAQGWVESVCSTSVTVDVVIVQANPGFPYTPWIITNISAPVLTTSSQLITPVTGQPQQWTVASTDLLAQGMYIQLSYSPTIYVQGIINTVSGIAGVITVTVQAQMGTTGVPLSPWTITPATPQMYTGQQSSFSSSSSSSSPPPPSSSSSSSSSSSITSSSLHSSSSSSLSSSPSSSSSSSLHSSSSSPPISSSTSNPSSSFGYSSSSTGPSSSSSSSSSSVLNSSCLMIGQCVFNNFSSSSLILTPYPNQVYPAGGGLTTSVYSPPANPLISTTNVTELATYAQTVTHTTINNTQAWSIRIGSAGQIYSIVDSVGNQYVGAAVQAPSGEWQDRVYQTQYGANEWSATIDPGNYFQTQAGSYSITGYTPAYGIKINEYYDNRTQTYSIHSILAQTATNWLSLSDPSTYQVQSILQTSVRDLGDITSTVTGFEITHVITNFGLATYDGASIWCVFDSKSMEYRFDSHSLGSALYSQQPNALNPNSTYGGWSAFSNNSAGVGPTMALIVQANASVPGSVQQDVLLQLNGDIIFGIALNNGEVYTHPGQTFYMRHYILFSTKGVDDIAPVASGFTNQLQYTALGNIPLMLSEASAHQNCSVFLRYFPSQGCNFATLDIPAYLPLPILILQEISTGGVIITTNPYYFPPIQTADLASPSTKHVSRVLGFLGWSIKRTNSSLTPPCLGMALLSTVLSPPIYNDPITYGRDAWIITNTTLFNRSCSTSTNDNSFYTPDDPFRIIPTAQPQLKESITWQVSIASSTAVAGNTTVAADFIDTGLLSNPIQVINTDGGLSVVRDPTGLFDLVIQTSGVYTDWVQVQTPNNQPGANAQSYSNSTMTVWVYPQALSASGQTTNIIATTYSAQYGYNNFPSLVYSDSGKAQIRSTCGGSFLAASVLALPLQQWSWVTVTMQLNQPYSQYRIYINGSLSTNSSLSTNPECVESGVVIGNGFRGLIHEATLYDHILKDAFIAQQFQDVIPFNAWNATQYFPFTANLNDSVNAGQVLSTDGSCIVAYTNATVPSGVQSQVLNLSCSSQYRGLMQQNYVTANTFTFSGWVYASSNQFQSFLWSSLVLGPDIVGYAYLLTYTDPGYPSARFQCSFQNYTNSVGTQAQWTLPNNLQQWNHIVISYNGSTLTNYLNGTLIATASQPTNVWGTLQHVSHQFAAGWQGLIWHFYYWNYALSNATIQQLYSVESQ